MDNTNRFTQRSSFMRTCIVTGIWLAAFVAKAQYVQRNAAQIQQDLHKLNVLGNVLYVAAHPDDENTRLIAYFSNEVLVNTAYLAATRGDGGQNLIGAELREGLGVIRTQELLAARRVDGGQQFFTRANDFGYSKTANETLQIWDKDNVLADMVWVIRKFRPDVIITRFPPDKRAGHGHHTSSAILAEEAFKLAGDKNAYPEQLNYVEPWQPVRLLINSGRWWDKDIEKQSNTIKIDVGTYNSLLGVSYTEMAATSRSQHKSQGFGATHYRGTQWEYVKHVAGTLAKNNVFEGIDLTWARVGKPQISSIVQKIIEAFNPEAPYKSIPRLLALRNQIQQVSDTFWQQKKLNEVDALIRQCAGLFIEATATSPFVVPGDTLAVALELVNRGRFPITLQQATLQGTSFNQVALPLDFNSKQILSLRIKTPENLPYTPPYWLKKTASLGMYRVDEQLLRGLPENPPAFTVDTELEFEQTKLKFSFPVVYKWTERVQGENYRPLNVVPAVTASFSNPVNVFKNGQPQQVQVQLKANRKVEHTRVTLNLPKGWAAKPAYVDVQAMDAGAITTLTFKVQPHLQASGVQLLSVTANADGVTSDLGMQTIAYSHIPYQVLLPPAQSKAVALNVQVQAKTVGYIMGAGDEIPAALEQLGVKVWLMNEDDITPENLANLDAVVLGVRAINTQPWLVAKKKVLLTYVANGGTLITQYNTTRRLHWQDFAPYSLQFTGRSADSRVTEEDAQVTITQTDALELNFPNKITSEDFNGWVQERGLYFPVSWDKHYRAPLAMQDTGEKIHNGSLLIATYGKGHYVYTGLSFFRELPAGVPGGYRLFANLLSLQQSSSLKKK